MHYSFVYPTFRTNALLRYINCIERRIGRVLITETFQGLPLGSECNCFNGERPGRHVTGNWSPASPLSYPRATQLLSTCLSTLQFPSGFAVDIQPHCTVLRRLLVLPIIRHTRWMCDVILLRFMCLSFFSYHFKTLLIYMVIECLRIYFVPLSIVR